MTLPRSSLPNLILFEDEHLLAVNKPAGLNTHSPSPFAGEGIYDWLRHREPRWASLAIIHRLDKETSGVLLFAKTPLANRSLTGQFAGRRVGKEYRLVTDRKVSFSERTVESTLVRAGDKYFVRPLTRGADPAVTRFRVVDASRRLVQIMAEPVTGRTHQIRAHAAAEGFPILGDVLYGGTISGLSQPPRLWLHAEKLTFTHPSSALPIVLRAPANFAHNHRLDLRSALIDPAETNAFRLVHGAADGWPGLCVDRLGDFLLVHIEDGAGASNAPGDWLPWRREVEDLRARFSLRSAYVKPLDRHVRRARVTEASPRLLAGECAPERFHIVENGVRFEASFREGCSFGLFLDQRDNRRRFLINHVAAGFPLFDGDAAGREILNTFAYTCGFSVCAAMAGARTTSLDLSKKYLEWGKRNFALNGLSPDAHDFIYGDVFDWLRRLATKGRAFDAVILDPPTFSQSKERGVFRAEKDFRRLIASALPVLNANGVLLTSTNAATFAPEKFLEMVQAGVVSARRRVVQRHYVPQPPDFPITRETPAYLKTVWLRIR